MKFIKALPVYALLALTGGMAFGQANTALSNLVAPTAINADLLFNSDNTYNLGSSTDGLTNIYTNSITGGSRNFLTIIGQSVASGNGGIVAVDGGDSTDPSSTSQGGSAYLQGGSNGNGLGGNVGLNSGSEVARAANDGVIQIGGHTVNYSVRGASPTPSACGTAPSVAGTDSVGRISVGTGGGFLSCTITFSQPWVTAPVCNVNSEKAPIALKVVPSTTAVVITAAANFAASTVLDFQCQGYQ